MASVRLTTGQVLELDGDLLALIETLYREISLKSQLKATFEDVMREIQNVVAQMSEEDRKRYFVESLFLNSVTYENEMLDAYARRLAGDHKRPRARIQGRSS
jgi:hypothetical protein